MGADTLVGSGGGLYVIFATTLFGVSIRKSAVKETSTSVRNTSNGRVYQTDLGLVFVFLVWAT